MKGIYLIAFAFLAYQTGASVIVPNKFFFEVDNECPASDPCPPILLPHKEECGQFYECKNGEKILKDCATGLHFSEKWSGCVKPENADCDSGSSGSDSGGDSDGDSGGDSGEDSGEKDKKCTSDGQLLPHECKCYHFYECKNKQKILHTCPGGQFFHKMRCIPGKDCKATGPECVNNDLIAHECQCEKYYLCKNGQKALRECKKGEYFDIESLTCVKGRCPDPETCHKGEKKKHDCLCEKYYACKNKNWILQECKNGRHFSPTELKCMRPDKAGCDESGRTDPITPTTEPTTTPDPGPIDGTCPKDSPTYWQHECDCRLYYECVKNEKVVHACAWGKYFDYFNQVCDKAEKVKPKCRKKLDYSFEELY